MIRFRARRHASAFGLSLMAAVAISVVQMPTRAASPSSATLSLTSGPVTWTGFPGPASSPLIFGLSESTCQEGTNCDTFVLRIAPGDYTGKRVRVRITWTNELNDFDLYVRQGSTTGPLVADAGDPPPEVVEEDTFDLNRAVLVEETYYVRTVYYAVVDTDAYSGTATVEDIPVDPSRTAVFIKDGDTGFRFSRSRTTYATGANSDSEPSARVDYQGNAYTGGIRGVPAGNDIWRLDLNPNSSTYDPFLDAATPLFDGNGNVVNPAYKGQPDAIAPDGDEDLGADGGGDLDIAVGFKPRTGAAADAPPTVATSSLVAANVSTQRSLDRGDTFQQNAAGNTTVPVDDRQWNEFYGGDVVYLAYRQLTGLILTVEFYVNRSDDGGLTYGPAVVAGVGGNITGNVDVDQSDGTVYFVRQGTSNRQVVAAVGKPPAPNLPPVTYTSVVAATGTDNIGGLFPVLKVAKDGTVYVAYTDGGKGIFIAHSSDQGATWSKPVQVSSLEPGSVALMPWMETGDRPGAVGVVWYGTEPSGNEDGATGNTDKSNWKVYYATVLNAKEQNPKVYQAVASDRIIHGSNISLLGFQATGTTANRNLLDFFQVAVDPLGLAFIAYASDANDFNGHTYVTHQLRGISLDTGKKVHVRTKGNDPGVPAWANPEVHDFKWDWRIESRPLLSPDTDHASDIVSIDYGCELKDGKTLVTATMKTTGLTSVPASSFWRMNFASHPTQAGVSDRADQWFIRADTNALGAQVFTWGTAVRTGSGGITYTSRGAADEGSFDTASRTVTVKVDIARLNALQTRGAIGSGTTFIGLRGSSQVVAGTAVMTDQTRGGSSFALGASCFAQ